MRKKGFSLVELLIYMGLLSALLVVLSQIFTSIIQAKLSSESNSSVEQNANYIMNRFIYDISRSSAIPFPTTYGSSSSTLQLTINGANYSYAVSNGVLQLTTTSGTDNLSDSGVTISNLTFTKIGSVVNSVALDTVKITFTLTSQAKSSSGAEVKNYQISVAPR